MLYCSLNADDICNSVDCPLVFGIVFSVPHIEVKNMSIHQSIDAPLTISETATFSGSLSTQNGNGSGNVSVSCRSVLSTKTWGEVRLYFDVRS